MKFNMNLEKSSWCKMSLKNAESDEAFPANKTRSDNKIDKTITPMVDGNFRNLIFIYASRADKVTMKDISVSISIQQALIRICRR